MMDNRGVILLNVYGLRFCERLAVCLYTLRKHWTGGVTVFADTITEEMTRRIAEAAGADVRIIEPYQGQRRNNVYVTKTMLPTYSPYDQTVLLDADTTVHAPIDELFTAPITLTRFSTWVSRGKRISGRIGWFRGLSPAIDALIEVQLSQDWPAINTGCVGFHKGHPWLSLWHAITLKAAGIFISDELGAQLIQGEDGVTVLGEEWNYSPMYGTPGVVPKIAHYHGGKSWRKEQGKRLWEPELRAALAVNFGGIAEWIGLYDKHTHELANAGATM